MSNNKTFDTPYQVKFIKNILIGNIQSLFQVMKSPLSLQSPIVNKGVPHHLVRLFQRPLTSIENQIITLTPNDPREAAF